MFEHSSESARQWLALLRAPRLTYKQLKFWLSLGDIPALFAACSRGHLPELKALKVSDAQRQALASPEWKLIDQDLAWLEQPGHRLVPITSSHYPRLLQEITPPPLALFVDGQHDLLHRPQVAIVGSRHPTHLGLENAKAFALELSERGFVVSSGLALGIDGAAHQGALAGGGVTLAVLGTGCDVAYPASHRKLTEQIRNQGVLVSEFFPGTAPRSKHFPRRNRILSGLALGTLVVEATPRSGSLITARYANEQGREVFAIPGSIHNPLARGCHQLIAQGAALVTSVDDIESQLSGWPLQRLSLASSTQQALSGQQAPSATAESSTGMAKLTDKALSEHSTGSHTALRDQVGWGEPTSVDILAARTGVAVEQLLPELLELELQGLIQAVAGGYVRARGK